ncbi:MAG: DNA-directed RNA polymerase subunit E' [Candidatus Micrarchaeota archaeon]|nr:MAG: DNA-directed RNA polymerase subunit E' [Candidatus Micrarchaeota archaeon]
MYYINEIKDRFRLKPKDFGRDINEVAVEYFKSKYEGRIDKDLGLVVAIISAESTSDGSIILGEPDVVYEAKFKALCFMPKINEVYRSYITELAEFGAFARVGPIDALVHISQISGDKLHFNRKLDAIVTKDNKVYLKKGDIIVAKISTISLKDNVKDSKIALTMRGEGLGRLVDLIESKKGSKPKSKS